jgi:hypothetical protein
MGALLMADRLSWQEGEITAEFAGAALNLASLCAHLPDRAETMRRATVDNSYRTISKAELTSMLERSTLAGIEQALAEERALVRPLLVDLVAFVDLEHEDASGSCHPQPGKDCVAWCEACQMLARVPADVLTEARQVLRERGIDRD